MARRWLALVGVSVGVLMAFFSCAPGKAPEAKTRVPAGYESLRIVGASIGSEGTTVATAMSVLFNRFYPEVEWSSCSGSTGTSPIYVTKGQNKLATGMPVNYIDAYGYDKVAESRLRSISVPRAVIHYFFIIPEDKPWKDITEVPKGATLVAGTPGSSMPIACEAWLNVAGLSKKDFNWITLGKSEAADSWRTGKTDVGFISVAGMAPDLMDMWTSPRKFKAMGMTPQQAEKARAQKTFERIGFEAPTMGNLTELVRQVFQYDVVSPQAVTLFYSRDDFPEEMAYKMAKILDEHLPDLVQIYAGTKFSTPQWHIKWAKPPMDIHPGVAKYYREKGYLK